MEYINEFVKYKEAKGEKAIYRVNDTRGYTYYSDDYVKWLEQQLRLFAVVGRSEQLVCGDCAEGRDEFAPEWKCPKCRDKDYAN
jgi:hypothetical protein